jgi:hypothetical protein
MNQPDGDWDGEPDEWFRPVWVDLEDETERPLPFPSARFSPQPHVGKAGGTDETLLGALAAAQDALARLDAQVELVSEDLRAGLIARLAYAEAAGLLAARGGLAHPLDLALRDNERLGRPELYARGMVRGRRSMPSEDSDHVPWLEMDDKVGGVLLLARLLQHLPAIDDPLAMVETAQARFGLLGSGGTFDGGRFAAWHAAHWPDGRRAVKRPALLRAAEAAAAWMESGIADIPDAAQALAVAALLLRRTGTLKIVPLPVWSCWTSLCAADEFAALPRLRGDVSARLAGPDGASWPVVFLYMTAESARAGMRILASLRRVEASGLELAAGQDRRSRLPAALSLLLRHPALTAPALARQLNITPQASLRILGQLAAAGVVAELTGRKSFRAFGVVGG